MILSLLVAGVITLPLTPVTGPVVPPVIAADPCAHVTRCTELAPGDITGDGLRDRIGYDWSGLRKDGTFGRSTVRVIVTSPDGQRYTHEAKQFGFFEGSYGNAPIDGVPGNEIALSWIPGAHSSMIQVITFRDGQLQREQGWSIDGIQTYGGGVEWIPGESPAAPIMRQCRYDDVAMGGRPAYQTTTTDYTWTGAGWTAGAATVARYGRGAPVPTQCMRFIVPGMARAPIWLDHR